MHLRDRRGLLGTTYQGSIQATGKGSIKVLLGSFKALLRLCSGSFKALLRLC
jgi:hypothetical protein